MIAGKSHPPHCKRAAFPENRKMERKTRFAVVRGEQKAGKLPVGRESAVARARLAPEPAVEGKHGTSHRSPVERKNSPHETWRRSWTLSGWKSNGRKPTAELYAPTGLAA